VIKMAKSRAAEAAEMRYEAPRPPVQAPVEKRSAGTTVFTIGDLSREFGVTLRALRFYEDKGLLSPARDGMTRLYGEEDREHLQLILKGKRLGFTLVEIADMIADRAGDKGPTLAMSRESVRDQIAHLERRRVEIDEANAELKASY
jgi:DNA-binding transcriptional MerR regulator